VLFNYLSYSTVTVDFVILNVMRLQSVLPWQWYSDTEFCFIKNCRTCVCQNGTQVISANLCMMSYVGYWSADNDRIICIKPVNANC